MAAKKSVPVRLKTGTYIHKEKRNGKEEDVVYKAHDEKCNVIFVGVAEAKELLERFVNKFEIINEIEYKAPEQPDSEPETEEVEEEVETPAGGDEDYGTEVTKSFDESKGTKCKVYIKNDLYTVIGPEGEVIKQGVNENSARKSLKRMQPTE